MNSLDDLAPNYRRARTRWNDAPTLARHYATVDEAYQGSGQSLIEAVKSYIECVCRTIIVDYGGTADSDASTTRLLVAALERLGMRNSRGASRFDSVLSAHNKLADALSDARNHDAPIAHGKDGFLNALAHHHVRLYLLTGDTILSLLLGALDGTEPNLVHTREPYERFKHFNSTIDAAVEIQSELADDGMIVLTFKTGTLDNSIKLRVEPSRFLYGTDRAAYVEVLESLPKTFRANVETDSSFPETNAQTLMATAITAPVRSRVVTSYSGFYAGLKDGLKQLLLEQGLTDDLDRHLHDSILATFEDNAVLDWATREPMRARVLVAFKRVLRATSLKSKMPANFAETLLQWFIKNEANADFSSATVERK